MAGIAVTLGPACDRQEVLQAMLRIGVRCFRIAFSHDLHGHAERLAKLRAAAQQEDASIQVYGDLCGPRFRVGELESSDQILVAGEKTTLVPSLSIGSARRFGTNLAEIASDIAGGDRILIDEGRIQLRVVQQHDETLTCRVERGGRLLARKGINLPDSHINIPPLTTDDRNCLAWAVEHRLDGLFMSFVHTAEDVQHLRRVLAQHQAGQLDVVAKIETLQATQNLETIAAVSDALLIARGDLGVEVGPAQVPAIQSRITAVGKKFGIPLFLATHIFHSMMEHPEPTAAEIADVTQAVGQGVDTLLLTGETAIGNYPVETVQTLYDVLAAF